jgi:hypothetical protein
MVKSVGHSLAIFKKVRVDPWCIHLLGLQETNKKKYKRINMLFLKRKVERRKSFKKRFIRYVYRLDIVDIQEPRRRYRKRFTSIRIVKFFYLTLVYFQFRTMARNSRKKDGFFEGHYCLALEGRLLAFLYRTGFVADMFESLAFVRNSSVTINRRIQNFVNQPVALYALLALHPRVKKSVYFSLVIRLCVNNRSLFNAPRYMYISYWFIFAFMLQNPLLKDLPLPRFVDVYRATGYAH